MEMEMEIISTDNVAPSSPTPQSQQTYKLSMLDQLSPAMIVPFVLYYPNPKELMANPETFAADIINQLKRSLSVILTRFYPIAGRVNPDGQSITCNDHGVPFTVVRFSGTKLSDLLVKPNQDLPRQLLPCAVTWDAEQCPGSSLALVQVSQFSCGGFAIGLVFWHKVVDAVTIGSFIDSWAGTARAAVGDHHRRHHHQPVSPNYIVQSLFPFKPEIPSQFVSISSILATGRSVMRRYVFDKSAVSSLKWSSGATAATRVEAVTALIWRCFMAASSANGRTTSVLIHAVNLRRRSHPPFSSDCFGNFPGLAAAAAANQELDDEGFNLGRLIVRMREAVGKIDGDFVGRLMGDGGFSGHHDNLGVTWGEIPPESDLLSISSWCGFGFYEKADFGFGRPAWVTRCESGSSEVGSKYLNVVWLMDTSDGEGVEAWVILDEKYMSVFGDVKDLQDLSMPDPSPLDVRSANHCPNGRV